MNVLFVCHRFPFPPNRGGKIRPFNTIKHFGRRHRVTVASLARNEAEAEAGKKIAPHCHKFLMEVVDRRAALARMALYLPTPTPSSMGYFRSNRLARRVREEVARERFDLIFVHCSSAAQYVEEFADIPKIMDFGDMDSQKWLEYARVRAFPLSLGYRVEGEKLQREEARLARKFDMSTCTTRAELETLKSYGAAPRTGWYPNGVDLDYFKPTAEPYDPDRLCFIGRMDYYPNQDGMFDFCANVLPLIRERRPGVKLSIVGSDPPPAVRKLAEIPGVEVTGSVPDVRPYTLKSALTVATLNLARGTQNKVLESLAMGVPTVAKPAVAGGVDAVPGEHFLVGETPRQVADHVLRLLDDPGERARFAAAGRARMESHHDWARSMDRLDAIVEECLAAVRPAPRAADLGTAASIS